MASKMDVLDATVAVITFPPSLDLNDESTNLGDKLKGFGSVFYNEILSFARINATMIASDSMGDCVYSETLGGPQCTGIAGLLYSGEANLSVMPVTASYDQRLEAPFEVAYCISEQQAVFLSSAVSNATAVEIHILSTALRFDKVLLAWYLALYCLLIPLINWSSRKGRFMCRLQWPDAFKMLLNASTSKTFLAPHRRVTFFVAVLLTFIYYQLYMGSTETALVVEEPDRYLQSLADIDEFIHTLVMVKGLAVDQGFASSEDPSIKRVYERTIRLPARSGTRFIDISNRMKEDTTIAFCSSVFMCRVIQAYLCINTDCEPGKKTRISPSFNKTSPLLAYSRLADYKVKHRFRLTHSRLIHSGIYDRSTNDIVLLFAPVVASYEGRFRLCLTKMSGKEMPDSHVPAVNYHTFHMIYRLPAVIWIFSFICLFLEHHTIKLKRKKRKQGNQ